MQIELFTDGAAKGNPGPGGFGTILRAGNHYKELSGGFQLTTNNRMELLAVIVGLEELKKIGSEVLVTSDSKYVVEAVEKGWLQNWLRIDFKNKKNKDLWLRYHAIASKHRVRFRWIKGHAGHVENERCDALAVAASQAPSLAIDHGYIESQMM
jgi:ribonuclease HI